MTRRTLLLGAGAGTLVTAAGLAGPSAFAASPPADASGLPPIAPLPAGSLDRSLFSHPEQRLAPYLVTLAPMVNEIVDDGAERHGWMAGGWWRTPVEPFNARIQEHVRTLAWFATTERDWNPYHGDPALLARLDAAIRYYLSLQHEEGFWSEFEPTERSRAATAFALGYLSKTLEDLRRADRLPGTRDEISAALHRAMTWFLDPANEGVWQPGSIEFVNQPMAGLAGATLALRLDPDPGLATRLRERTADIVARGQSPAGYFYEPRGMDIAYNLNVTLSEIVEILDHTEAPELVGTVERFADWLGYNLVREPDGAGYIANTAGSARTPMYYLDDVTDEPQQRDLGSWFTPLVPAMAAFYPTDEDRAAQREAWAAETAPVPEQERGATNPRILVNIPYGERYPTCAAKAAAVAALPYLASDRFTELRRDPRGEDYLFVRRPGYYTMAHYGPNATPLVRSGLSLIWHPEAGTLIHGGHNSNEDCWATVLPGGGTDAAADLTVAYFDGDPADGVALDPEQVATADELGLTWRSPQGNVTGAAVLDDASITRRLDVVSEATEQVPLLLRRGDRLTWTGGPGRVEIGDTVTARGLRLRRGRVTLDVHWGDQLEATVSDLDRTYFADARGRAHVLRVAHPPTAVFRYRLS
ncbi:hypothetical protein [Streptomyces sp. NBRC 109706]|uniref:hypothetical protein n=1 Tax=Streptomyces sp. NBRC 109706 TaxID=1550035 RepID=UPI00078363C8|nr:hypothetical protein [Streptomyces sp. NBRC 109706]